MPEAFTWVSHRDDALILPRELQITESRSSIWQNFVIRLLDLLIACGCLVLALPLFLVVPVLIKLNSPGRIFFIQPRLGLNGKPFRLIKFRTMVENQDVGRWTRKNDPRITRMGKILRQFHLDEIPQLINVLKGEMTLVGPRPYTRAVHDQICRLLPEFDHRLRVKPGLTGWAQLVGRKEENPLEHHAALFVYDLRYLSSPLSAAAYLRLIIKTIRYFLSEAAYRTF